MAAINGHSAGTQPSTAELQAMLLSWNDGATAYTIDAANKNFMIRNVFAANTAADLWLLGANQNTDCVAKASDLVLKAVSLAAYALISIGVLFLLAGISCFCYMRQQSKDSDAPQNDDD